MTLQFEKQTALIVKQIAKQVERFLETKLKERKLNRQKFAQDSGIPASTINGFMNEESRVPTLKTLYKIAQYFDCTIDDILERSDYSEVDRISYNDISFEDVNNNIRDFIKTRLEEHNLEQSELGPLIGRSKDVIRHFMNGNQKTLGIELIVALADYFGQKHNE